MAFVLFERAGENAGGVKDQKWLCLACQSTGDSTGGRAHGPMATSRGVSLTHRVRGHRTPEVGTGAQCAMLHRRPRARRLAAGIYTVCHVDFIFPCRRLTHLCRKPRARAKQQQLL